MLIAAQIALGLACLLCSLVAGFLFAFAVVVMPGIKSLGDGEFLRAFQDCLRLLLVLSRYRQRPAQRPILPSQLHLIFYVWNQVLDPSSCASMPSRKYTIARSKGAA